MSVAMIGNSEENINSNSEYLELLKRALTGWIYPESAHTYVGMPKSGGLIQATKRLIVSMLARMGYRLVIVRAFDSEARENGKDWPSIGYTMVGLKRLNNVQQCIETVLRENIPGDFCETGVWRGGCTIFMRAVLRNYAITDRLVWACDSFEGMPKPNAVKYPHDNDPGYDLSQAEMLSVPLETVKGNFVRFGLLDDQVRFVKGWFSQSLPTAPIKQLSILRLDGDLYESTWVALTSLYDKLSPGGFVIVDDYNIWGTCKKAITDFRESRSIQDAIVPIDEWAVYWRKAR